MGRSIYLTLTKEFELSYNPGNVIPADINENDVTLTVFINKKLHEIYRIETGFSKIVIAYSERRKKIASGRSTRDREVRKHLKSSGRGRRI